MSDKKASPSAAGLDVSVVTGNGAEAPDKVERIREIIFGAQMRDYAQKFEVATRELTRLNREIERLNQQLREQETAYKRQLREEVERLTSQLHDLDRRQTQQVQDLERRQTQELEAVDQKQGQRMQELDHVLHAADRDLLAKLRELSDHLNHVKVDREALGELLVNLGASLRTNAPAPLNNEIDLLDQLSLELS